MVAVGGVDVDGEGGRELRGDVPNDWSCALSRASWSTEGVLERGGDGDGDRELREDVPK